MIGFYAVRRYSSQSIDLGGAMLWLHHLSVCSLEFHYLIAKNNTVLSLSGIGIQSGAGIVMDQTNKRVLVIDDSREAVFAVDLTSGQSSVLSESNTSSNIRLLGQNGIALDELNNRALVTDFVFNRVIAVDLSTGNRSILSDANTGSGTDFSRLNDVIMDVINNRALVIQDDAIIALNLANGNRSVISNNSTGLGDEFKKLSDMVYDADNNRVLVIDSDNSSFNTALFSVNLTTGDRTVLSNKNIGSGINFGTPSNIIMSKSKRLFVTDSTHNAILAVDINSGDRAIISK